MQQVSFNKTPEKISLSCNLPSSKSLVNRALILQKLAPKPFELEVDADSEDTKVLKQALLSNEGKIDCKMAGTAFRFLTAYFACTEGEWILDGDQRLRERPIAPLVDALRDLGAEIEYLEKTAYAPLLIKGKELKGGKVNLDARLSSQFVSALLLIAPKMERGLSIKFTSIPVSRPYFNMTVKMLNFFNIQVRQQSDEIYVKHKQSWGGKKMIIEGDWSSASYFMAHACAVPGSKIEFPSLVKNSWQGDRALTSLMMSFGLKHEFNEKNQLLVQSEDTRPEKIEMLLDDHPDLAPTFICLAVLKEIPFHFSGLSTLKFKESNRLERISQELQKLGISLNFNEHSIWSEHYGEVVQEKVSLNTWNDHRLAMAFSLLAHKYNIAINEPNVVQKSFPEFWEQLKKAGFDIKIS